LLSDFPNRSMLVSLQVEQTTSPPESPAAYMKSLINKSTVAGEPKILSPRIVTPTHLQGLDLRHLSTMEGLSRVKTLYQRI
jgi:hypothetical protein